MLQHEEDRCAQLPRAEAIARLNDQFRKHGTGGSLMVTRTVAGLKDFDPIVLTAALADYEDFDADNDPHGERDFGDLRLFGSDLLWKIDYYDLDLKFGSDDPVDPAVTRRVLTIMIAAEW